MKNKPHLIRLALATMLSCLWSVAAFAAPTAVKLPNFSSPVLDGATQPGYTLFDNVIPNALADYYTYVPFSNADAVALGFPKSCGNKALTASPLDQSSTDDCYTITVKSFYQALALDGIFGFGKGLIAQDGTTPLQTKAFGYGSGGLNWAPPGAPVGTTVTGNAPTPFSSGPFSTTGIWHFPAPTIKGTFGRPIRVQWLNELPNEAPVGLDPSVDCGPNAPNCFPYNRISTHVHGAHVGPESDGLASAWYTPGFAIKGEDFVSTPPSVGPEGTYYYPMDQEASTIWYHDHAMGTTHNNTDMGMAGFWPITDANEKALVAANILPTGAYELGFALQDRHFDAATGNMVMPDAPIFNLNSVGCGLDVNGLATVTTCPNGAVLWMKAKDPNNPLDLVGHFVPYNAADTATLTNGLNGAAPYPATSATLEYFGNIPVVNGVVYGNYAVEPRVYRMRFIGGTDSRTWLMKLQYTDANAAVQTVPFWQIGTEQGLLNKPVLRQQIDLMGGERVDVLVDFSSVPPNTKVMMKNLGPDTPWPGAFEYQAGLVAPSVDIPEIMAFNVGAMPAGVVDNIVPPSAATNLRPLSPAVPAANATPAGGIQNTRVVSLMEITDGFGRTMPTIDSRGFKPVDIPVTEIIKLNDTEQWDIVNTTVDAHPMHLHQVAFKVINRQALAPIIDPLTGLPAVDPITGLPVLNFTAPTDNPLTQVFTPPSYVATGSPIAPDAWDDGWKDTVASPPGYVTRVWAKFDLVGEYVWHCHILSHEEHDMMRNFIVTDAAFTAPTPAKITVPATAAAAAYTVNWVGTAIPGVTYELQEATDAAFTALTTPQPVISAAPNFTTTKIANGTFYYRVRAIPPATSGFTTSAWKTAANPVNVQIPLTISATALVAASVNAPYSTTTATTINGVSPFSWSVTGTLPAGLTFDITTGVISGTPAPAAVTGATLAYPITVTVTDSATPPVVKSAPLSLVINQVLPAAPTLLTATAFGATQVNLKWTDNATNETGFTVQRATNAGFTRALVTFAAQPVDAKTYSDTTAVAGTTYYYRVASTNIIGLSAYAVSTLVKPAALAITAPVLAAGSVNLAYTATVVATGGAAPYTWSASGLPASGSLSINPATGVISGTLTPADVTAGALSQTYNVTITVQDSFTPPTTIVSAPVALIVNQVLPAAPTTVTAALVGLTQINLGWVDAATNETGYIVQRATDKAFLIGLVTFATLPAGTISFTDTTAAAGTAYYYRVASSNILGNSKYVVALPKPVTTLAPLAIPATTVLKAAKVNAAYTTTLKATGGLAPYTWTATSLPTGLSITPAGVISAVAFPSVNPAVLLSTITVNVTVNDAAGSAPVSVPLTIAVTEVKPAVPTLLTVGTVTATQVDLAWTASSNASGYTVQRTSTAVAVGAKKAKATTVTFVVPAGATVYSDITAVTKTTYTYKVNATNIVGASAFTAAVTAITP
jgi:spore coat protein A